MIHSQHLDIKKEEPYVQSDVGISLVNLLLHAAIRHVYHQTSHQSKDSHIVMRMPSTTDSRILEMAFVGQPFNL